VSINIGYFLSEAGMSFRRNWVMSLGAVVTIFLSLLLIGSSLLMNGIVNDMVVDIESKINIQVWISDNAEQADIDELQRILVADENVKDVHLVSKDEAMERLTEMTKDSPEIVQQLKGNPLPRSLDIELVDSRNVEQVVELIKSTEAFPKIADPPDKPEMALKYGQGIVTTLFNATRVARYVGIVLVAMLAVVSLIFINNTIRLAIYARRNELSIMRLVGASNWFIRAPFILEGVLQSLIGAFLAIVVLLSVKAFLFPRIRQTLTFVSFDFSTLLMGKIAFVLIVSGVVFGAVGAIIAMRKYLKV